MGKAMPGQVGVPAPCLWGLPERRAQGRAVTVIFEDDNVSCLAVQGISSFFGGEFQQFGKNDLKAQTPSGSSSPPTPASAQHPPKPEQNPPPTRGLGTAGAQLSPLEFTPRIVALAKSGFLQIPSLPQHPARASRHFDGWAQDLP